MKKFLMMTLMFVMGVAMSALADDNEIVVSVAVPGQRVTGKVQKALKREANKLAVKKYLKTQNAKVEEKVLDEAAADAEKYVEGDPSEEEEPSAEDGEVTAKYTVTIKQEELAQFLDLRGLSANVAADGSKLEIFVMEEPPDAGQIKLGDKASNFFFERYTEFQKTVRDALVAKVKEFGFKVILLEDNENYEEMKRKDPALVGVFYDVNADTKGFVVTPNFVRTVQENNPDAIVLYYRIAALAFDPVKGSIRVRVALSFKNLADNSTTPIGKPYDYEQFTSNTEEGHLLADFATAVGRAISGLMNKDDMGAKLNRMVTSMRAAAARPKGPMKLVINCSMVDKKIRIKFRVAIKKALIEKGLTDQKNLKIVKDSLSCKITKEGISDLDELWVEVEEIIREAGVDDITDEAAKKNDDTLTVTPGK